MPITKTQASGTGLTLLSTLAPTLGYEIPYVLRAAGAAVGMVMLLWPVIVWAFDHFTRARKMWLIAGMGLGVFLVIGCGAALLFSPKTTTVADHGLLRKYPSEIDRENLRTIFRDISTLVNQEVSPAQLEVHRLINEIPQKIGNPAVEKDINRLSEIRSQFERIRNDLYAKYVTGQYYADEAWDILENTDPLYSEMNALDQYVDIARGVRSGDPEKLVRVFVAPRHTLEKTNGELAEWTAECLKRIRTKRHALDG